MTARPVGMLGGTFNPIHHGHLRLALELYERLSFAQVHLVPAANPPHREKPTVGAELRFAMVQAAVAGVSGLIADDRELKRQGFSYTVDTLRSLRNEYPNNPLCLILGMDAFIGLPTWQAWESIIELAHLVVVRRPGTLLPMSHRMHDFLVTHQVNNTVDIHTRLAGKILVEEIPALTISATQIRTLVAQGRDPSYLIPLPVLEIIQQYQLYR
ncbi:nicotinate-nucleotide adenylyltransferase [Beggiatoa leptomitoformis]|uniref:Probable nicotinate-nucleotide adenylyltransferase n=1 Tax=Beggiatoa leptomitoformis TaxID=288004 RepID=A0A2N9YAB5_9GAMM|nr:nicotinate-nucleotide adenylyltransferase [Beggiatoa leptomitoformis]ALG67198.1 nicotinate-nucleotide adenylyltransferase [Beggiatoa leptomitoformis]AUI67395.1 nicotinate-nucleotide adenylyltransferase [Beggiatoa leptomitoformis]